MKSLARQRDIDELRSRLRRVRPESVARWGRMSARQMVCHLADAFRMATGDTAVTADTSLLRRTVMKWIALYAPLPWPPALIRTVPEIDQCGGAGTAPAEFAADVAAVQALMERLASGRDDVAAVPHPYFGRMSRAAWLRWGYLHVDHHLRQFGA